MACWCGCSALKLFKDLMYCGETESRAAFGQESGGEQSVVGLILKKGGEQKKNCKNCWTDS